MKPSGADLGCQAGPRAAGDTRGAAPGGEVVGTEMEKTFPSR